MKSRKFNSEKLQTWQKARAFISKIYTFSKEFPLDERYSLRNQIGRSAISICINLSEGGGKIS
jgi:four helix bundle protein